MKHSIGVSVAAGTNEEVVAIIPSGYLAIVYLIYVANTNGSTGEYTLQWQHSHDLTHKIRIAKGKSLGAGEADQYSNGELILQSEDLILFSCSVDMDIIIILDIVPSPIVNAFEQDDEEE